MIQFIQIDEKMIEENVYWKKIAPGPDVPRDVYAIIECPIHLQFTNNLISSQSQIKSTWQYCSVSKSQHIRGNDLNLTYANKSLVGWDVALPNRSQ